MRWIAFALGLAIFSATTAGALVASTTGWGLTGLLDKPVSIRQASTQSGSYRRRGAGAFIYWGGRRHRGGGYGYGK